MTAPTTNDPLVLFVYLLLRDGLPTGRIVDLVRMARQLTDKQHVQFDEPAAQLLFQHAQQLLGELRVTDAEVPTDGP